MVKEQLEEVVYELRDHVYSDTMRKISNELFYKNIITETDNKASRYVMEVQAELFRSLNNLLENKRKLYNQLN